MYREERQVFTLPEVLDGKAGVIFQKNYLPESSFAGSDRELFIKSEATDARPDGVDETFWITLDRHGKLVDEFLDWIQYIPHRFLIKLHYPKRNPDPSSLVIDYIIDTNAIVIDSFTLVEDGEAKQYGKFRDITITAGMYNRDTEKIRIDELITDFNNPKNRDWIFRLFVTKR